MYSATVAHTFSSTLGDRVRVVGSQEVTPSFILHSAMVRRLSSLASQVSQPPAPWLWMSMNPGREHLAFRAHHLVHRGKFAPGGINGGDDRSFDFHGCPGQVDAGGNDACVFNECFHKNK